MKRIIAMSIISFFCATVSFAQPVDSLAEIKGVSAYNATILGYAINCGFDKTDTETVKSQFVSLLDNLKLNKDEYEEVQKSFFDTLTIAKDKGPSNSGMVCAQYKVEFDKIVTAIKTGRTPS